MVPGGDAQTGCCKAETLKGATSVIFYERSRTHTPVFGNDIQQIDVTDAGVSELSQMKLADYPVILPNVQTALRLVSKPFLYALDKIPFTLAVVSETIHSTKTAPMRVTKEGKERLNIVIKVNWPERQVKSIHFSIVTYL